MSKSSLAYALKNDIKSVSLFDEIWEVDGEAVHKRIITNIKAENSLIARTIKVEVGNPHTTAFMSGCHFVNPENCFLSWESARKHLMKKHQTVLDKVIAMVKPL